MRTSLPAGVCLVGLLLCASCLCAYGADGPKRKVNLPPSLQVAALFDAQGNPRLWQEVEESFRRGDAKTRAWVENTLRQARAWAQRPDAYYEGLFRPESPFGSSTICCPYHPQMSGWVPFNWDPDQPWRLTCPLCEQEGRKPAYYPNDLYPDDGHGCRPTDEVWRQTHDEAWSKKYSIPWERWDKHTHGHIDSFAYFFLGYCQWRILFEMNWRHGILDSLCQGYLFASRLYPEGSPEGQDAPLFAHKAKLLMVMMSRSILGDPYLREVLGLSDASMAEAAQALARDSGGTPLPLRSFPGYEKKDNISDHSAGDREHPLGHLAVSWWNNALTIYPGSASQWALAWLESYAKIQDSFTPRERELKLDQMVERLLVSAPEDGQRLGALAQEVKPGVVEEGLDPYNVNLQGNLAGGAAFGALNVGLMLRDPEILRTAVTSVHRYLRSYFTTDGLGYETSPHYTQVALNNLAAPLALIDGLQEGFGPEDAFWSPTDRCLRPYLDPALMAAAFSPLLSILPDGRCAPWCDSWVTEKPSLDFMSRVATRAGKVPEQFLPWLDVSKDEAGAFRLKLKEKAELPSYVLEANGLAVVRSGSGPDATFLSVDWSKATGHSHSGPFNLLVYSVGHEMLYDQGYLNNVTPTQDWMDCAESHNTALVRTANGNLTPCINWRGAKRFFADTPTAKAVEVAEEDKAKLQEGLPADQKALYRRTVVLLSPLGAQPAWPYVVDIFRLQGGTTHEYYLHSLGDTLAFSGLDLSAAEPATTLYDLSHFSYRTGTGAKAIRDLRSGATDRDFTATWSHLTDWRTIPPEVDLEGATFAHLLGAPGTQVFAGTAPGQRYIGARDVEARVNLLCARRDAEAYRERPDAFVAAIGFSRDGTDPITALHALSSSSTGAVGLCIEHGGGVDYVLSALDPNSTTAFEDTQTHRRFALTGALAVLRYPKGGQRQEVLLKADKVTVAED
ncbi:MAG: hypothetical protein ABFE16_06485 [Armatimonadia bacterium]